MKVDLNKEVNIEGGARAIFIASFAIFIFTSLFATSLASASISKIDNSASVVMSNKYAVLDKIDATDSIKKVGVEDKGQVTTKTTAYKPKVAIKALSTKVNSNNATKLNWESESVTSCMVKKDGVQFSQLTSTGSNGISTGLLTKDTLFTIDCNSEIGTVSASVKIAIIVVPATTVTISSAKAEIEYGQNTYLTWKSENAKTCSVKKGTYNFSTRLSSISSDNTNTGALYTDTKFVITCIGLGGEAIASVDIKVKPPVLPTAKITISNTTLSGDEKLNVSWSSTNANKCAVMSGTRNIGNKTSGKIDSIALKESSVIWITCSNAVGSVTDSASVQYSKVKVLK